MKKLIILLSILACSFAALAQGPNSFGGVALRVNDTTTYQTNAAAFHTAGYYDIYFNNQATNDHWDIWNGSSYDHIFSFNAAGGAGLGDVVGPGSATDAVPVLFDGTTGKLVKNSTPTGTGNPVLHTSPTFATLLTTPLIKITSGVPGSGKVLTSDADGDATWETPSGGGGTIASQATVNTGTNDTEIVSPLKLKNRDGAVATLTDGASISITSDKNTLATSTSTRTFTIAHTGDEMIIEVTLSAASSLFTFPAAALCVSEGVASGNNTCSLAGVSGDKYIISISKLGSNYYVFCKNMGQ